MVTGSKGSNILDEIEEMSRFGNRWMGSIGEEKTRKFIVEKMSQSDYTVSLQPFSYLSYEKGTTILEVAGREIPCEPLAYSFSTLKSLNAPLLYVGQGTEKEFDNLKDAGVDVTKFIVLSDNLRSFSSYPIAEKAGALGFILATTLPDNTIRCGTVRFDRQPGKIPAVSISGAESRKIISVLQQGEALDAKLLVQGATNQKIGHNILARPKNDEDISSKRLLFTAHYDSFWNGVHAMDNLAGVATLLTLAQEYNNDEKAHVDFVFFGGEELGSWGASGYVNAPDFNPQNYMAIINLDAFGSTASSIELGVTPNYASVCRKAAEQLGIIVDTWSIPPRTASDHKEFLPYNIPVVWIANHGTDEFYHTPLDTVAGMSSVKLDQVFKLTKKIAAVTQEI